MNTIIPRTLTVLLTTFNEEDFQGIARLVVQFDPTGRDHALTSDGAFLAGVAHANFDDDGEATVRLIPNSQLRLPDYQWNNRYIATIYASRQHVIVFQMPDRDYQLVP